MTHNERKAMLEQLVDKSTLLDVLKALSEVCEDKSEHILTNWQDANLSKVWSRAGVSIDRATANMEI